MHQRQSEKRTSLGLLILRLGIGGHLLTHGIGKVKMVAAGNFEQMGDPIGLGPVPSLILIAFAEFICSILVMVGLGTRLASIPVVIGMAVAALVVHRADPWTLETAAARFFAGESQYPAAKEVAFLYLVPFLTLMFLGGGEYSLDAWFARRRAG